MKIGGFLKQSFVDFPRTLSAVIFTCGCNFNCWYCHNADLIKCTDSQYDIEKIFKFLESRYDFLEGVVISGGEPTLQADLSDVIKRIKNLGFKVKLDTNGSNPQVLKDLLSENVLDYVAMDIKNSIKNYAKTICVKATPQFYETKIKESIEILKNCNIDYEFRTTFSPEISLDDISKIAKLVKRCKNFYLQKYNSPEHLDQICQPISMPTTTSKPIIMQKNNVVGQNPRPHSDYNTALKILQRFIPNALLRGF